MTCLPGKQAAWQAVSVFLVNFVLVEDRGLNMRHLEGCEVQKPLKVSANLSNVGASLL